MNDVHYPMVLWKMSMLLVRAEHLIFSISNHRLHLEAYVLSFATGNWLPLLFDPKLIEFPQFVSRDSRAFSQLDMNRTAAYILKDSLSVFVWKKVVCRNILLVSTSTNAHKTTTRKCLA